MNSLLRLAIQQKLKLTQRLEDLEMDSERPTATFNNSSSSSKSSSKPAKETSMASLNSLMPSTTVPVSHVEAPSIFPSYSAKVTANLATSQNSNSTKTEPNQVAAQSVQTAAGASGRLSGVNTGSNASNSADENGENPFSRASLQKKLRNITKK